MKKFLAISAAVVALAMGTSISSAQLSQEGDWYVIDQSGGTKLVIGPANPQGTPLLTAESNAAPANCPAGSFWETPDGFIVSCEDQTAFELRAPESGQMMASGQAYPEGAKVMVKRQ